MSQVCTKCNHVNPSDASYCYFDGMVLAGHSAAHGPVNAGSTLFPNQFFFPNGQVCRNFDQLAMTCNQEWASALELLKQGFLASFFGGLGRADLARAAQEAARFPDADRGLDQLLAKLPTQALQAPKLLAEPTEVNLGQMQIGQDRTFELHLINQGQRLLYGSVVSDCKWLVFGEGAGTAQKVFQFSADHVIVVHVRGSQLRAGHKPLEGQLVVESNGGTTTIRVRVEVPVKPFAEGVLAGALTPRQIAEKAKAQPKEAAALFEHGRVAAWFKSNGWTYPVQGPSASGLGAVQQFFEALGLATAPKVEISEKQLLLAGAPGQSVQATLRIETQEKRPVYAHATCADSWLDVSRTTLNGRIATIHVVARIPNRPGERLQAKIKVHANGNQRFVVPLILTVTGTPGAYVEEVVPVLEEVTAFEAVPGMPMPRTLSGNSYVQAMPVGETASPFVPLPVGRPASGGPPPLNAPRPARIERKGLPFFVHLLPLGLLMLALFVVLVMDFFEVARGGGNDIDAQPRIAVRFEDGRQPKGILSMRFGVESIDPHDPKKHNKLLTYGPMGETNSTVVRIDGGDRIFGFGDGQWEGGKANFKEEEATKSVWKFNNGVRVTQLVKIVPGEAVDMGNDQYRRFLDTCLVRYIVENQDTQQHSVGLRFLLDTLIGLDQNGDPNDGVPFTVPGKGLVDTSAEFNDQAMPAFIQVLEKPDLKNPGLVAQLGLGLGKQAEVPSRVRLTNWPNWPQAIKLWDIPLRNIGNDSCVVIYWDERSMKPGEKRELAFTYGLGNVASKSGQLGVTVGGNFTPGGELSVVGLVSRPEPGETLTLKLPDGLRLVDGSPATQNVPEAQGGRAVPVTWHVVGSSTGTFTVDVQSSRDYAQKKRVTIRAKGIF